ncbi:O-antigen/teichoic acid export membrane protein [Metapseudomonas resinovorans]|uniref:flippase n=1 Tax=Metapseudomonas resinovorans TaxID=53412 RepID=UPI003D25AD0B
MARLDSLVVKLLKGGMWAFAFRLLASLSGFITSVLLTRILDPAEVGAYFLILSAVSVASALSLFGLNFSLVRLISEFLGRGEQDQAKRVIGEGLCISLLCSFFVAVLAFFIYREGFWGVGGAASSSGYLPVLVGGWIFSAAILMVLSEIFRGLQDLFKASVFSGFLASFLSVTGLAAYLVCIGRGGLSEVVGVVVLSTVVSCSVAFLGVARNFRGGWITVGYGWKKLLFISAPLWVTNLMLIVLMQVDVWILVYKTDSATVGLYGAASRMIQFLTFPMLVINSALMPVISELFAKGEHARLEKILRGAAMLGFVPAVLVFMCFLFFGEVLLGYIYGEEYSRAHVVLVFLAAGQLVSMACGAAGYTLMMTGRQKAMMWITVSAGLVSVILSLALVSRYGALGVAAATSAGLSLQCIVMWSWVYRANGIWTHPSFDLLLHPYAYLKSLK